MIYNYGARAECGVRHAECGGSLLSRGYGGRRAQWISNGLREFWDKATVLRLAARAFSKQYCLRRTKDDELYCVRKSQNSCPKIICSLELCSQFIIFKGVRELALRARFFGYFGFAELVAMNRSSVLCFKTKKVRL